MTYAKCPDCGKTVMCGQCRSDIAAIRHEHVQRQLSKILFDGMRDLFTPEKSKGGKNWLGKDGSVL